MVTAVQPVAIKRKLESLVYQILSRVYVDGIDRILAIDVNDNNTITGTFQDEDKFLEFTLSDEKLSYKLIDAKLDSYYRSLAATLTSKTVRTDKRSRKKNCVVGISCGNTCIERDRVCSVRTGAIASAPEMVALRQAVADYKPPIETPSPTPPAQTQTAPEAPTAESPATAEPDPLDGLTIRELKKVAGDRGVYRYSYMNKDQLKTAIKAADEDSEQQERLRKTIEKVQKERDRDPVREWRKVVASKNGWKNTDIGTALKAGAVALGISWWMYDQSVKRYRGNFAQSAGTAEDAAKGFDVPGVPNSKPYITFTVDSFSTENSENRGSVVKDALEQADPEFFKKHHIVAVSGENFTELDPLPDFIPGPIRSTIDTYRKVTRSLGTALINGRNPQAIELATQIYAYHQKYPDKQINLIGHSVGGSVIYEAAEIVKEMSDGKDLASNLRIVTLGTSYFGITEQVAGKNKGSKGRTISITSTGDPTSIFPRMGGGYFVNTVKGHDVKDYMSQPKVVEAVTNAFGKNEAKEAPDRAVPRKNPYNLRDPRNNPEFDWANPFHVAQFRDFIKDQQKQEKREKNDPIESYIRQQQEAAERKQAQRNRKRRDASSSYFYGQAQVMHKNLVNPDLK